DHLKADQGAEQFLAVVGATGDSGVRIRHHREHRKAQTADEEDVGHHRHRRSPGPHARAVFLGHDWIPERRGDPIHPTSSEVARMKASSSPPSTWLKADTLIPPAVNAWRIS